MTHKGECFCGAVQLEVSGDTGGDGLLSLPLVPFVVRPDPSTPSRFGTPMPCGSQPVPNTLVSSRRRRRASGNIARNAVVT